jgi:hypothetical protein
MVTTGIWAWPPSLRSGCFRGGICLESLDFQLATGYELLSAPKGLTLNNDNFER